MIDPKKFLTTLSTKPGVYRMFNEKGQMLYVGKARNLKKRLSSYFRKNLDSAKTTSLMKQVTSIEVTITASENEALLLESNIIKENRPRYNVLMRDDKSYPYLFLSTQDQYPRLDYHRGAKRRAGRYFGPYPNSGSVRENLALIQKLFKLRQCSDSFFRSRSRPCLQYQIQRCTAPCVGYVKEEQYREQVNHAILFLEGKNSAVIDQLAKKMDDASIQQDYEVAAVYRDQIRRLRKLQSQQAMTSDQGNIDVLAIVEKHQQAAVAVVFVRGGRVIGHKVFFPKVPKDTSLETVMMEFIPQYYLSPLRGEQAVDEVIVNIKLSEKAWLQSALQDKLSQNFKIIDTLKPVFRQWLAMAKTNAHYGLVQRLTEKKGAMTKLLALQRVLKLPNPIQRIECFDVSHTQGELTIASCVVYGPEGASNKEYRRFNIKGIKKGDDYAAMRQVIKRRYTRIKESDGMLPDLVIIDGGRGQLKQAESVFEELQITGVDLIAVAKGVSRKPGLETIYHSGTSAPIILEKDDIALHLIQFIRDESHRFAITAHRNKRSKVSTQSPLEFIEGVGAKRRRDLLRHFGGLQELRRASVDEIAKVPGISLKLAERIYDALR